MKKGLMCKKHISPRNSSPSAEPNPIAEKALHRKTKPIGLPRKHEQQRDEHYHAYVGHDFGPAWCRVIAIGETPRLLFFQGIPNRKAHNEQGKGSKVALSRHREHYLSIL